MKKKLAKTEPRAITPYAWYYVNPGSVDVVTEQRAGSHTTGAVTVRLTRKMLTAMLAELPPKRT